MFHCVISTLYIKEDCDSHTSDNDVARGAEESEHEYLICYKSSKNVGYDTIGNQLTILIPVFGIFDSTLFIIPKGSMN